MASKAERTLLCTGGYSITTKTSNQQVNQPVLPELAAAEPVVRREAGRKGKGWVTKQIEVGVEGILVRPMKTSPLKG